MYNPSDWMAMVEKRKTFEPIVWCLPVGLDHKVRGKKSLPLLHDDCQSYGSGGSGRDT